jgi:molybdenum cofactor cytidylyltransferase
MALHALMGSSLKSVMVVVHPEDPLEWVPAEGGGLSGAVPPKGKSIHVDACIDASQGMGHSIRHGLRTLMDMEAELDAVVVTLADQPFITSVMINELIHYWLEQPELDYVATAVHDTRNDAVVLMPPAILSSSMFEALLQLEGDAGARKWFGTPHFKGCGLLAVNRAALIDVDTPEDFEMAKNHYIDSIAKQ